MSDMSGDPPQQPGNDRPPTGVRALALYALCCVAKDCEVTCLQLDEAVFSFLLDKAGKRRNGQECDWALEEVFFVLASTSRSQSNRQLMANTEFFKLMADVLPRTEEYIEKHALTILTELAKESDRFRNITGAASLIRVLKRLQSNCNDQASQKITAVLVALAGKDGDGEDAPDSRPHLTNLLADKVNVLSILGIGEVQFVLDHLHHLCSQGSRCCTSDCSTDHSDHTLLQGLQALAELALEEEDTKKEIVDKGGLETVRSCMREDTHDTVQRQALMVLLALTASTHCCKKMKAHDDLLKAVEQCRQSTSPDLSEMAEQILTCLGRHTV